MQYRSLGRTGLEVSEIGYGAWGIGGIQWKGGEDDESIAALKRAIELGLNFIDTALAYGEGHSERLVGKVIRESDGDILVATKIPPKNQVWPARSGHSLEDVFPYDYAVACTEQSLKNLGIEQIDLQQFHVWNPEWVARDEWRRAIEDLKASGKVSYFGISINDHQPDSALSIIETGLIDTVQVIYNIFDQSPHINLFPVCLKHNVGVIARVPLDEGALSGNIHEDTVFDPNEFRAAYFRGDHKKQVVQHVDPLIASLHAAGVTQPLAEVALRFCLSHPAVSTVIPGMRKIRHVESNCALSDQGPLHEPIVELLLGHAWEKNFYPA
ncbi:MAG: aldo/keto reductase [Bryobacterales bacterium]|nr:aldo/keto reductase [Bryobacterales bacterium]